MPGHVDVAVQALLVRLAQAVVHGAGDLDRVGEVAEPAGGDPRPQTDSGQLPLDLGDQRRVLLSRNLRKFSLLLFFLELQVVRTWAPGIIMKPRSEPVEESSGAFSVHEAA